MNKSNELVDEIRIETVRFVDALKRYAAGDAAYKWGEAGEPWDGLKYFPPLNDLAISFLARYLSDVNLGRANYFQCDLPWSPGTGHSWLKIDNVCIDIVGTAFPNEKDDVIVELDSGRHASLAEHAGESKEFGCNIDPFFEDIEFESVQNLYRAYGAILSLVKR